PSLLQSHLLFSINMQPPPPISTLFPYTTLFRSAMDPTNERTYKFLDEFIGEMAGLFPDKFFHVGGDEVNGKQWDANKRIQEYMRDRKSTRLNSSHLGISYAVFCLKKKKKKI